MSAKIVLFAVAEYRVLNEEVCKIVGRTGGTGGSGLATSAREVGLELGLRLIGKNSLVAVLICPFGTIENMRRVGGAQYELLLVASILLKPKLEAIVQVMAGHFTRDHPIATDIRGFLVQCILPRCANSGGCRSKQCSSNICVASTRIPSLDSAERGPLTASQSKRFLLVY